MDKLAKLCQDVVLLWSQYWRLYMNGVKNTLILALTATVIGCIIGLICGILNTIPLQSERLFSKTHVAEADSRDHQDLC